MQHLTNEEVAKVYAMYWGQDAIIYATEEGAKNDIRRVTARLLSYPLTDTKLLLTPISDIADEHARIINENILKFSHDSLTRTEVYAILSGLLYLNDRTDTLKAQFSAREIIQIEEQLTLWGYDKPLYFGIDHWANGKTAIELGIAIDKNENK